MFRASLKTVALGAELMHEEWYLSDAEVDAGRYNNSADRKIHFAQLLRSISSEARKVSFFVLLGGRDTQCQGPQGA